MSEPDTLLVLAASYDNVAAAEADYQTVKTGCVSKEIDANADELARQLQEAGSAS
jgi:hypothetical protein